MVVQKKKKKTVLLISVTVGVISLVAGVFLIKNIFLSAENKDRQPTKTPPISPLVYPEEQDDCPYNEKSLTTFSQSSYERANQKDLARWKLIPRNYIVKCWKKGYHWHDIIQLWGWKIPEEEIPDLTSQERVGVINGLIFMPNPKMYDESISTEEKLEIAENNHWVGRTTDLVIIVRKIPHGGPQINIDEGFGMRNEGEWGDRGQVRKIINLAFQQENIDPQQCEVSVLWTIGVHRFGNEWDINCGSSRGSSGGSAIYLALLSVLHRKPISRQVAATGTLGMSE